MILTAPLQISARLMPAVHIPGDTGGWISLGPDLTIYIDPADDTKGCAEPGLRVPRYSDDDDSTYVRRAMGTALSFLAAFAEAHDPRWPGEENRDLFPHHLGEWAYLNADEITMLQLELEEE